MDNYKKRAEFQRKRIIYLLEELADVDHKQQCKWCGSWWDNISAHEPHCDGNPAE